jgi:hypothetical protein
VSAKSRVCGGVFTPDPAIPADHRGRLTCVCGLTGEPGDPRHTPAAADSQDAQQLAAGERSDRG